MFVKIVLFLTAPSSSSCIFVPPQIAISALTSLSLQTLIVAFFSHTYALSNHFHAGSSCLHVTRSRLNQLQAGFKPHAGCGLPKLASRISAFTHNPAQFKPAFELVYRPSVNGLYESFTLTGVLCSSGKVQSSISYSIHVYGYALMHTLTFCLNMWPINRLVQETHNIMSFVLSLQTLNTEPEEVSIVLGICIYMSIVMCLNTS